MGFQDRRDRLEFRLAMYAIVLEHTKLTLRVAASNKPTLRSEDPYPSKFPSGL